METLNLIYSKTYNFVYLRAKSLLKKEEDVQQLMKEVYVKAVAENIDEADWYKWLGKQVYLLGSAKFRKKKVREAELIELSKQAYSAQESVDKEKTREVICEALEELPDLYHATLYAFYYDLMKVKDISSVMGYSVGVIINRLNYIHKYIEKTLKNYQEEHNEQVQFSVEVLCEALYDWSENNQLGEQVAQNVYASICRELGVRTEQVSAVEMAGLHNRVVECKEKEEKMVCDELEAYSVKQSIDKKKVAYLVGIGVLVFVTLIGVIIAGRNGKKDPSDAESPVVENEQEEEDTDAKADATDDSIELEETNQSDSEYILPKSDTEKLTREDLEGLSKEELRLARNEIYARHGMIFGVEDLDQYFASKSWYQPTVSYSVFYDTIEMSIIEEVNVSLILQVEKEKN